MQWLTGLEQTEWKLRNPLLSAKIIEKRGEFWWGEVIYPDNKGKGSGEFWHTNLCHVNNPDLDIMERTLNREKK